MVADQMAFLGHSANQIGLVFHEMAGDEKGGRNLLVPEYVQNTGRIPVLVAVIEGQIQILAARISKEYGVLLPQDVQEAFLRNGRQASVFAFLEAEVERRLKLGGCDPGHRQAGDGERHEDE